MTVYSKILYVEDNEADALMLKHLFARNSKSEHVEIETVETVEAAKKAFDASKHAAVLIDWILPDGKGADVSAHIRQVSSDAPILFLSGINSAQALATAETLSHCEFEKKGHSNEYVERILQRLKLPAGG